jgi:hypothetical protein
MWLAWDDKKYRCNFGVVKRLETVTWEDEERDQENMTVLQNSL